jgi:hypothetical protein
MKAMRESWITMTLTYLGNVHELLTGGGGKLSPQPGDSGDIRKPPGGGF